MVQLSYVKIKFKKLTIDLVLNVNTQLWAGYVFMKRIRNTYIPFCLSSINIVWTRQRNSFGKEFLKIRLRVPDRISPMNIIHYILYVTLACFAIIRSIYVVYS